MNLHIHLHHHGDSAGMIEALEQAGVMDEIKKQKRQKKPICLTAPPALLENNNGSVSAEDIYNAYPRKIAKKIALEAIKRACANLKPSVLLERTIAFAKTQPANDTFTPHPATWFNQERFNDDPASWERTTMAPPKPRSEREMRLDRERQEAEERIARRKRGEL